MVGINGNRSLLLRDIPEQLPEEQSYQARLREAIYDGVTEADVTEVIKGIVERAKRGDKVAIQQMMDYVLGAKTAPKSVTIENHFTDVEQAARLTSSRRRARP